jgi:hypothetical protein
VGGLVQGLGASGNVYYGGVPQPAQTYPSTGQSQGYVNPQTQQSVQTGGQVIQPAYEAPTQYHWESGQLVGEPGKLLNAPQLQEQALKQNQAMEVAPQPTQLQKYQPFTGVYENQFGQKWSVSPERAQEFSASQGEYIQEQIIKPSLNINTQPNYSPVSTWLEEKLPEPEFGEGTGTATNVVKHVYGGLISIPKIGGAILDLPFRVKGLIDYRKEISSDWGASKDIALSSAKEIGVGMVTYPFTHPIEFGTMVLFTGGLGKGKSPLKFDIADLGDIGTWKGITFFDKPLAGYSKATRTFTVGMPEFDLTKLPSGSEIRIGSKLETNIIGENIKNIPESLKTARSGQFIEPAKNVLIKTTGVESPYSRELPKQTLYLGEKELNIFYDIGRTEPGVLFGSTSRETSLAKTFIKDEKLYELNKVPKDIELRFDTFGEKDLQRVTDFALKELKGTGGQFKLEPSKPYTIWKDIEGKWEKVAEFKGKEPLPFEDIEAGEYVLGVRKVGTPKTTQGLQVTKLDEELRGVTQGIARVRKVEGKIDILPSEKRMKDIGSFSVSARTFLDTKSSIFRKSIWNKGAYLKDIEKVESLFPKELVESQMKLVGTEKVLIKDFSKSITPMSKIMPKGNFYPFYETYGTSKSYGGSAISNSISSISRSFSRSMTVSPISPSPISSQFSMSSSISRTFISPSMTPSPNISPNVYPSITSPYISPSISSPYISPSISSPSISPSPSFTDFSYPYKKNDYLKGMYKKPKKTGTNILGFKLELFDGKNMFTTFKGRRFGGAVFPSIEEAERVGARASLKSKRFKGFRVKTQYGIETRQMLKLPEFAPGTKSFSKFRRTDDMTFIEKAIPKNHRIKFGGIKI